jgi:hypothetical protein
MILDICIIWAWCVESHTTDLNFNLHYIPCKIQLKNKDKSVKYKMMKPMVQNLCVFVLGKDFLPAL